VTAHGIVLMVLGMAAARGTGEVRGIEAARGVAMLPGIALMARGIVLMARGIAAVARGTGEARGIEVARGVVMLRGIALTALGIVLAALGIAVADVAVASAHSTGRLPPSLPGLIGGSGLEVAIAAIFYSLAPDGPIPSAKRPKPRPASADQGLGNTATASGIV